MDEKEEDKSEKSKIHHIKYYQSLKKTAQNMQNEADAQDDKTIQNHLKNRIDAIKKDMQRIEQMFPETNWNETEQV